MSSKQIGTADLSAQTVAVLLQSGGQANHHKRLKINLSFFVRIVEEMHLSTNLKYDWLLQLTDDELTTLQRVLRGDELDELDDAKADKLSVTLDMIRVKAERSRALSLARRRQARRDTGDFESDNNQTPSEFDSGDQDE